MNEENFINALVDFISANKNEKPEVLAILFCFAGNFLSGIKLETKSINCNYSEIVAPSKDKQIELFKKELSQLLQRYYDNSMLSNKDFIAILKDKLDFCIFVQKFNRGEKT